MSAAEIATAYIALVPTTKGIAGQLESQIVGPSTVAGAKAGKGIGDGVSKSAKPGLLSTNKLALGVAAGIAAIGISSVSAYQKAGAEVLTLRRRIGGTAEDASKLRYAFAKAGIDGAAAAQALALASRKIASGEFEKVGIAARNATGQVRPLTEVLGETADKFKAMPDGADKTALAMDLFGRSGAKLLPFLDKGSAGLDDLYVAAGKVGVVFNDKMLDGVVKNTAAQRDLKQQTDAAKFALAQGLLPAETELFKVLGGGAKLLSSQGSGLLTIEAGGALAAVAYSKLKGPIGAAATAVKSLSVANLEEAATAEGTTVANLAAAKAATALGVAANAAAIAGIVILSNRLSDNKKKAGEFADSIGGSKSISKIQSYNSKVVELQVQIDRASKGIIGTFDPSSSDLFVTADNGARKAATAARALNEQVKVLTDDILAHGSSYEIMALSGVPQWEKVAAAARATADEEAAAKKKVEEYGQINLDRSALHSSLGHIRDQLDAANSQVDASKDKFKRLLNVGVPDDRALLDVKAAIDAVRDAFAKNEGSLDPNRAGGREDIASILDAKDAATQYAEALAQAGVAPENIKSVMVGLFGEIDSATGLTTGKVDLLNQRYQLTADRVSQAVKAANMSAAVDQMKKYQLQEDVALVKMIALGNAASQVKVGGPPPTVAPPQATTGTDGIPVIDRGGSPQRSGLRSGGYHDNRTYHLYGADADDLIRKMDQKDRRTLFVGTGP